VLLLEEIASAFREHLVLEEHQAQAMALWAVHAHALDAALMSPRLALVSPEKRCGKTTALTLMQSLVPRPLSASNITAAALFRTVEMASPTLLIDEADTFLRNSDELRGILNSGHNRSTAFVVRTVGDTHEPARFRTWAAVAIAMIGRLPDTLADRSITISLQRKKSQDRVRRLRLDRDSRFETLRRQAARWVSDNELSLSHWDGDLPSGLHDRAADNWRPLLAIADNAGGVWPERARAAALFLSGRDDEGSAGALLLQDTKCIFGESSDDRISTATLLSRLHELEGRPWPEWKNGKPISPTQLARLLKPYGISPTTFRIASGAPCKGYLKANFTDAFVRYVDHEA
jgi:putative DNA primase/helicase